MSCWHAHGPWCHGPYVYPPQGYHPDYDYPPPPPRARRRSVDADELADYLQRLEEEITRVRRDLDELRSSDRPER
jgi:hypothetical protein